MRKIKFRGYSKRELTTPTQWVNDGDGVTKIEYTDGTSSVHLITPFGDYWVDEDSVGQYTELKDINKNEIYEGDIVQCNDNKDDLHEVKFGEFHVYDDYEEEIVDIAIGWYLKILDNDKFSKMAPFCYPTPLNTSLINRINIKVVGNIYENKELLEG